MSIVRILSVEQLYPITRPAEVMLTFSPDTWGVVEQRIIALRIAVVQKVIVDQIPSPTLIVRPQEGDVSMALERRVLGGNPYDSHRTQGSFPDHLPGVTAVSEADLAPGRVRALRHGIPM